MPSADQLISFQLTNLRQNLLNLYLVVRKANIDLFNDYLINLIDIYVYNIS